MSEETQELMQLKIDELAEANEALKEHNERLLNQNVMLEKALNKANSTIKNHAILMQTKFTRRQQKNYPKWLEEVEERVKTGPLELKKTFPFPKVGMRRNVKDGGGNNRFSREGMRYFITGLTERDGGGGFTDAEATDIVEYLNTFPENVTHLENLDSEFLSDEEIARRMAE